MTFRLFSYARGRFRLALSTTLTVTLLATLLGAAPPAWADHQVAPTGLRSTPDYEAVYLDWDAQGTDVTYEVWQSTDGAPFELVQSRLVYSEFSVYDLLNGTTYEFYVVADHAEQASTRSETVTATPRSGPPDYWPMCDGEVQQHCIVDVTVDGQPAPQGIEARVTDAGSLQWQWVAVDETGHSSYDLVADGGLTAGTELSLTLDLGAEVTGTLTSTGTVERLTSSTDADGDTIVEIVAYPARSSWLRSGYCRTDGCGDETTAADDDRDGMLIGGMPVRDAVELDALAGSWIATNAQAFTHPHLDPETDAFTFAVAAPHLMSDEETPNEGFFRAFLTDEALSSYWGIEDSSTVGSGDFRTHRSDGDQTEQVSPTVTPVEGGILIELEGFTYSTPTFAISPAPDEQAPVWPDGAAITTDAVTTDSFTVSWPAATDDDAVAGYEVTLDGGDPLTVTDTTFTATGLTAGTAYDVAVVAVDAAANASVPLEETVTTSAASGGGGGGAPAPEPQPRPEPEPEPDPEPEPQPDVPPYDGEGARGLERACPEGAESGYHDVPASDTHAAGIGCASQWRLFQGNDDGGFNPATELSRGQLASVLVRALEQVLGRELDEGGDHFGDDDSSVHRSAIDKLAETGIVGGYGDGTFGPNRTVSRGQFAAMLVGVYEYLAGELARSEDDHFTDDDGTVHERSLNALRDIGVLVGEGDGSVTAERPLNRAQAATMTARLLDALVEAGAATPPAA